MTAKEFFKAYWAEKKEADAMERRLKELRRKKESLQAVRHRETPAGHDRKDLSDPIAAIDELTEMYMRKVSAYMGKEAWILDKLEEMDDADERTVLILRYNVEGKGNGNRPMSWYDIAEQMHYSKRKVQYIHGDALQHFPME